MRSNLALLERLSRASIKSLGPDAVKPEGAYTSVKDQIEVYVVLVLSEMDIEAERERLNKELKKVEDEMQKVSAKLGREDFVSRAPQAVVEKERAKLAECKSKFDKLTEGIAKLKGSE